MNEKLNEKFLREKRVKEITTLSRTTRWRLEKTGTFPKRYQISPGITAYRHSEIMDWLESRPLEVQNG